MKTTFVRTIDVSYRTLDSRKKIINEYVKASCFSAITYAALDKSVKYIEMVVDKSNTPFSLEEIEKYFSLVARFGFPMTVTDSKDTYYCRLEVDSYINRLKFNSALTIMRYVLEAPFQNIVWKFLSTVGRYNKAERVFKYFEEAHLASDKFFESCPCKTLKPQPCWNQYGNTNHRLKRDSGKVLGYEKVMMRINICKYTIYTADKVSVNDTWS